MELNEYKFQKFRLSSYKEHLVTGLPKNRKFSFVSYKSGDSEGEQYNYSLTIGLTTYHLKWRKVTK